VHDFRVRGSLELLSRLCALGFLRVFMSRFFPGSMRGLGGIGAWL